MKKYILGIDTSAYTTSIAAVDSVSGEIVLNERKILLVPEGMKGLRQQEAVFQHMKNFTELYEKINFSLSDLETVSVSSRPRNVEGSYMPVFTVGQNYGRIISRTLGCSYVEYSHQENHIGASLINDYKVISDKILTIHISGGTTEFLRVKKSQKGYDAIIVGGTRDITFGQLIDRIGTYMGLPFPCGIHMEKLTEKSEDIEKIKFPPIREGAFINLSGMENYYMNLLDNKLFTNESIAYSLFEYTAKCIVSIIQKLRTDCDFNTVLITGGVAANSIIRSIICKNFESEFNIMFPSKFNSSDNAVGTAYLPIIDRWYNETKTN
jgi:N6-L-threonylcarbamoyladenine synthase